MRAAKKTVATMKRQPEMRKLVSVSEGCSWDSILVAHVAAAAGTCHYWPWLPR